MHLSMLSPRRGIPGIVGHLIPFPTLQEIGLWALGWGHLTLFAWRKGTRSYHDSEAILK